MTQTAHMLEGNQSSFCCYHNVLVIYMRNCIYLFIFKSKVVSLQELLFPRPPPFFFAIFSQSYQSVKSTPTNGTRQPPPISGIKIEAVLAPVCLLARLGLQYTRSAKRGCSAELLLLCQCVSLCNTKIVSNNLQG